MWRPVVVVAMGLLLSVNVCVLSDVIRGPPFACADGSRSIPSAWVNNEYCDCPDASDEPASADCPLGRYWTRGVSSKESHWYRSAAFTCLNGDRVIPSSQVNDNYCDCSDGSDEPGTSACSNGHFFCPQKGHQSVFIPSSRVNDGICDCCDGADEWRSSGVVCEQTCHLRANAVRASTLASLSAVQRGLRRKGMYVAQGQQHLEACRREYEDALRQVSRVARELADATDSVVQAERVALRAMQQEEQVQLWDALQMEHELRGLPPLPDTPIQTNLLPLPEHAYWDQLSYAKNVLEDTVARRHQLDQTLRRLSTIIGTDFGPDSAFYILRDKCFSSRLSGRTFELCPFANVTMDAHVLGMWSGWRRSTASREYSVMEFLGGDECDNTVLGLAENHRAVGRLGCSVHLECDESDVLLDATSVGPCLYAARFGTPAACTDDQVRQLESRFHPEEVRALNVDVLNNPIVFQ